MARKSQKGCKITWGMKYKHGVPIRLILWGIDLIIYFPPPTPPPKSAPGDPFYIRTNHENVLGLIVLNLRNNFLQSVFRVPSRLTVPLSYIKQRDRLHKINVSARVPIKGTVCLDDTLKKLCRKMFLRLRTINPNNFSWLVLM